MNRRIQSPIALVLCMLTIVSGCKPTQPFFFSEDGNLFGTGDLSHYMNVATEIEYPDVNEPTLDEVMATKRPLTLANAEDFDVWDVSLEEVTRITLTNSKVVRQLGGRIADNGSNIATATPVTLTQNPNGAVTTFDPALVESGNGTGTGSPFSGTGVESALAEFDAQLDSSVTWQKNDRPQNFGVLAGGIFASEFQQDTANYTAGITKSTANGTTFEIRNNTLYDLNNNGSRIQPSDWVTNIEAGFSQPLLQGAGPLYNRIAGPQSFQQAAGGVPNQIDGVIIARIRHDISLTDFEAGVRDLMRDVEDAYWELYFAYRDLETRKIGRDSALETWRKIKALQRVGGQGGEADKEAQSRSQYYTFRAQAESAQTNLFRIQLRLRYMMGLSPSDGRLLRPIDEPTTAQVQFDWASIHSEALIRRTELRGQKWLVKRRELELIASKNHLLPRLDAVGRYRWYGAGDKLINSSGSGAVPFDDGSNAFETLTNGNYQEWELGLQFSLPIGFRRAMTGVRFSQLSLARERAVLEDMELEVSEQLAESIQDVDLNFGLTQTNFNRRVAAEDEVEAVEAVYDSGRVTLDLLLETQRRRAEAESAYYRALVDYNRAIMRVHHRKGSLLEYNGVYLAEGPWVGKAQFDALRRARQRDASTYLDYGFTRPNVISRGPHGQITGQAFPENLLPTPADQEGLIQEEDGQLDQEVVPTPEGNETTSKSFLNTDTNLELTALPIIDKELSLLAELPVEGTLPVGVDAALHTVSADLSETPSAKVTPVHYTSYLQALNKLSAPGKPTTAAPANSGNEQILHNPNEPQANYTPAETAPNSTVGQRPER